MRRVKSNGIFYKLINFSDSSAIGYAITEDFGKLKFFINHAFTKKGSLYKIIPGEIDFLKKETSDLNKFYTFKENLKYFYFLESAEIYFRLYLIFEIFDILFNLEEKDAYFFKLLTHVKDENISKFSVYTINYMLKKSGYFLSTLQCPLCHIEYKNKACLTSTGLCCENCARNTIILMYIEKNQMKILTTLTDSSVFKNLKIEIDEEMQVLNIFVTYINSISGKKLKSFDNLKILK